MHFFGCLLGFFLIIFYLALFMGARLWWNIRNVLKQMGLGRRGTTGTDDFHQQSHANTRSSSRSKPQKQVFPDNEGEYVEFEEVH